MHFNDNLSRHFCWHLFHYCDVLMGAMVSQVTSVTIITQPFIQAQNNEHINARRH